MRKILSYIITLCLMAIVVLMLLRNKREIDAQIAFSEQKVEAYPVKVETVKPGTLDTKLELPGILSAADDLMLMAETQGRVIKIYKSEGAWVNKGEAIAQINDELMKAELMVTEANYKKAQKDLERASALSDGGAITQQQLEGLQLNEKAAEAKFITSRKRVRDALIRAPISGYINKLFLKDGGMIGAGVPVCELVNIRSLKMSIRVDENYVVKINNDQKVRIETEAFPGEFLNGEIISVGSKADYALQYEVKILIRGNPEQKLKAGMVATAIIKFVDEEEGPVISRNALVGSTKHPQVYILDENKAQLRSISIDRTDGPLIKVLEGVEPGEKIIVKGHFNLQDQMKVRVIE
ncbi:MAG: efflux RND transporter periplasmic adaptor subunit [Cytophagales bacterium]|nr:efflux RND transporter periplasmic adaptor subunit [Cytophagales bacterium]